MKYILVSLVFFISSNVPAQIGKSKNGDKITEIGTVERILGDYISVHTLSLIEKEGNSFYGLAFTNEQTLYEDKSPDQKILIFKATQDEFEYLYNFLLNGFEENQIRYLEIGQDTIKTLPPINKFLYIYVDFKDGTSGSLKLKETQLSNLFGKKNVQEKK